MRHVLRDTSWGACSGGGSAKESPPIFLGQAAGTGQPLPLCHCFAESHLALLALALLLRIAPCWRLGYDLRIESLFVTQSCAQRAFRTCLGGFNVRRFYQESWQGIPFTSFSHISFFHLAEPKFYAVFYEELFRRYKSWGDLPSVCPENKRKGAKWLIG